MLALFWSCTCAPSGVPPDESVVVESEGDSPDSEGVPDPGMPEFPEVIDVLHVTMLPSDTSEYSGTDDVLTLCLGEEHCLELAKPDWNDNEHGIVDVHVEEDFGLSRADVQDLTWSIDDGGDQYRPGCIAVSFDGEPIHCKSDYEVKLGTDDEDEVASLSEAAVLDCLGCWETPLTHGPLVGPVTAEGVRIWYRTDATRQVKLSVDGRLRHIGYPLAADDFAEEVVLEGIAPPFEYSLEIEGQTLGPWTVEEPAEQLRIAFGSCSKDDDQPIFSAIRAYEPDVFLFIGDNHYANTNDLGALRQWYRWAHERDERREMLAETSIVATWDDHDYVGNNTDASDPGGDVAKRVFDEYWANTIPSRHVVGEVEFFLLDDRSHRGEDDSMLGGEQTAWLVGALHDSSATWKLVASGSQFTQEGSEDSWANFPEDWTALLEATADVPGLVLLSGDVHRSEFRLLPGASYDLPELTSSPLATWNSPCQEESWTVCEDEGVFFIGMVVSSDQLVATLHDVDGVELASWTIEAGELEP
ncbi:MAG TPA: alkaline phosphatase D family protein [Myxococcota bacterium]|nr:alkaline phosphatase D family protein [Myxococcota bacterium]